MKASASLKDKSASLQYILDRRGYFSQLIYAIIKLKTNKILNCIYTVINTIIHWQ